jgi:outer membrane usher protein FimD/PapC
LGRHGGGERVNVQNRSAGANRANNANVNRSNNANANRNVNNNANVNRNVNVNQNVNVNRNVNVNTNYHGGGCYNCGGAYYHDDGWNAGSFAAGAAVGVATTAIVAAATRPAATNTTVVVQAPAVGTMIPTLPGGCSTINTGGAMIYNCSSVYYRPYYQGTTLVYQVVTYP